MIRYFGISLGLHAAALAAVFSVASLPRTDVVESHAGDTVTVTFHGSVQPTRQVVEVLDAAEAEPEDTIVEIREEMLVEASDEAAVNSFQVVSEPAVQSAEPSKTALAPQSEVKPPEPIKMKEPEPVVAQKVKALTKIAVPSAHSTSGGRNTPARNLHCPAPPYPERARRFRIEGEVRVLVHIGEKGRVRDVEIVQSSGRSDFDNAARKTILRHWKYEPAVKWGKPIASRETVMVEFQLQR